MPKNKNHHLFKHDQTEQTRKNDPLQHTCWKTHSLILINLHLTFIKSVDSKDQLQGLQANSLIKYESYFNIYMYFHLLFKNFIYFLIAGLISLRIEVFLLYRCPRNIKIIPSSIFMKVRYVFINSPIFF